MTGVKIVTAVQELIQMIVDFTPEQLNEFLSHPDVIRIMGKINE